MKRPLLFPLNPLYAAATALRNALYDREILPANSLPFPVFSIGNLSAGGTGKTPLVLALTQLLSAAGRFPVILSRGYGRQSSDIARVDPAGDAATFGDEPLLLARSSPAPVFVGPDRYQVGLFAAQSFAAQSFAAQSQPLPPTTIFLLDDGFQHRQLARDANIVLLSASDLTDVLLPAGNLREPHRSLSRADILVFTEPDAALAPDFLDLFQRPSCGRPVLWTLRRSLDLSQLPPASRPLAFAGIARPEEFFASLRAVSDNARNLAPAATLAFPDHHRYSPADLTRIASAATAAHADLLLTTEKDLVRLSAPARAQLSAAAPLHAVPLRTELLNPDRCFQQLFALSAAKSPSRP
jgi:tetraacyldisaccharide 4'-kinase